MLLVADEKDEPCMVFVTDTEEWYFSLVKPLDIHICNHFLRCLNLGRDIHFENYRQYGELISQCDMLLGERQDGDKTDLCAVSCEYEGTLS